MKLRYVRSVFLGVVIGAAGSKRSATARALFRYRFFDKYFNLDPTRSGIRQANNPDQLAMLSAEEISFNTTGYFYVYVTNESPTDVSFDNLLIKHYPGFLLQENHYYPFGLLNKALSSDEQKGFNQRYGFNGKEFEKGLDWRVNDFGARMYDPVLGRWGSVDPKAAKFAFQSPFVYCNNNPIYYIDPDGREGIAYIDHTNKTVNVKAVYFTEVGKYGFSADNYKQLQGINNTLNSQGYSITDKANALSGYSVKFELQFIPVTSEKHAQSFAVSEQQLTESNATGGANLIESGFNIGNSLILTTDAAFENIPAVRSTAAANSVSPDKVLGITDVSLQHINIPEKSRGNEKTAIHEIFHTLYFNKDNAKNGIGSGKQLPTNEDINGLMQGMQKIERTVEQKR